MVGVDWFLATIFSNARRGEWQERFGIEDICITRYLEFAHEIFWNVGGFDSLRKLIGYLVDFAGTFCK